MKSNFQMQKLIVLKYRNYKIFNNEQFRNDLLYEISKEGLKNIACKDFEIFIMNMLNRHAPLNIKYIRANNSPLMNKKTFQINHDQT